MRVSIVMEGTSTVSEFRNNLAQNLDGGAIHIEMDTALLATQPPVVITLTSTTISGNIASSVTLLGGNGGAINIFGAADQVDITVTSCIINTNYAKGGHGGFAYIPLTSTTSLVTVTSTTITSSDALNNGGLFYIGGLDHKILKLYDNPSISNSKANKGSGGIAHIEALSSYIEVKYSVVPSAAQLNNLLAGMHGGMFSNVVSAASVLGCYILF
jgi:hypothetical protein